jgi:GNAT superfamily N-acetyltransferase
MGYIPRTGVSTAPLPPLRDLSPAEAAAAIEANDVEFLLSLGHAGGGVVRDDPRLRWVIGGSPVDHHNCVVHAALAPDEVAGALDEAVDRFRAYGLPGTWHVGPTTRPPDLGERLLARGFTGGWSDAGMAADLFAPHEDCPSPIGLRIVRARSAADLAAWVRARALDQEGEHESRWAADMYLKIGLRDDVPWRHYVGWLGGQPVATATLFLGAGVAGVYFVLTVPEARRQGIGAAITLAALREARELGYRTGVLGASAMGAPLYRRLGFREYCRLTVYEWRPDASGRRGARSPG